MENTEYKRYTIEQCLQTQLSGKLYKGRDSVLHRDIMLYISEFTNNLSSADSIIQKIKKGSPLSSERYMHVLDIEVESESIMIILMPGMGRFLEDELESHTFTLREMLVLIRELGQSVEEAASLGIRGISLSAANIWIQEHNQPTLVNYWDSENKRWTGGSGLCHLLYQLIVRSKQIPDDWDVMNSRLLAALQGVSAIKKEEISRWVQAAFQDKVALSVLLEGLNELIPPLHTEVKPVPPIQPGPPPVQRSVQQQRPIQQQQPIPKPLLPKKEEETPIAIKKYWGFTKKKWVVGSVILCLLLVSELVIVHILRKPDPALNQPNGDSPAVSQNKPPQSNTPAPAPTTPNPAPTPDIVLMPDLKGLTQKDAEQQALALGLHYQFFIEANEQSKGTVFKQEPAAKEKVPKGGNITFYIGK
jgi:hypothetical protein